MNEKGYAVFLPICTGVGQLRQNTCRMLMDGKEAEVFSIVAENVYYFTEPIEDELRRPENLKAEYEGLCSVKAADEMRCVALWDSQRRWGVLIGWRDGQMLMAALPLITAAQLQWMRQATCKLQEMALQADELSVCSAEGYSMGDKLRELAREMMN